MPPSDGPAGERNTSSGVVLTRRGRLALTTLVVVTATAMLLLVQSLSAGTTPTQPLANTADGAGSANDLTGAQAPGSEATTSASPTAQPTLELPRLGAAQSPPVTTGPPAQEPAVVNGRTQPAAVAVPMSASGDLVVVPGSTAAVTGERVWTYRVEIERGLPFDGAEFATAVQATLADPRGWAQDGNVFQRVDTGDVDFRLVLASPDLTDSLCAPLQTRGRVSCRNGDLVVLNALRWGEGIEDYAGDVASYREYLVNHEVGHRLGRSHAQCPGAGQPAPVMMQQTYGLEGCAPNSWPLPGE